MCYSVHPYPPPEELKKREIPLSNTEPDNAIDFVHHNKGTTPGNGIEEFRKMLKSTIKFEASDLHIKAGTKPRIRVRGVLRSLDAELNSEPLCYQIARDILDDAQYKIFNAKGQIDLAYDYDKDNRFRINLFMALPRTPYIFSGSVFCSNTGFSNNMCHGVFLRTTFR